MIVYSNYHRHNFICCVDIFTKFAHVKKVLALSSRQACITLHEFEQIYVLPIHTIQTDNGSEFKGLFDKAIEELETTHHVWSYPKSPKTNGYVERFNWTIQDEFINFEIDTATCDIKRFDEKLKD